MGKRIGFKIRQLGQKIKLKDFLKPKKASFIIIDLIILIIFLFSVSLTLALTGNQTFRSLPLVSQIVSHFSLDEEITTETEKKRPFESKFLELIKKGVATPTPSSTPASPTTPQPTPTSKQDSTPTSTPTRTPNPPIINISYPAEMQSIEMSSSQNLCLVDTPAGGNTSGLQRKHNLNDGGWSSYVDMFTLCFDPKEGLNRVSLQYKNSFGDESAVYTRQFNFHRLQNITVTYSGQIYRDENCNAIKDSGEGGVAVGEINFFKLPEWYVVGTVSSDSNGNYSFSKTISEGESITLKPAPVSPSGYKSNPHFETPSITLNSSNPTTTQNLPQVPKEYIDQCY